MPLRYVSAMQAKSDENYKAGEVLVEKSYYSASVHCFYYSVLQKMKYVLCEKCGISYEEQESNSQGKGSHNYLRDQVRSKITDRTDKKEFKRTFDNLKSNRKMADYEETSITFELCHTVQNETEILRRILSTISK